LALSGLAGFLPADTFLVSKQEEERVRYTGQRAVADATFYSVKNTEGHRRHFTVENGQVVRHESYEAGFGAMLLEPDLERTIEVRGQQVHPHRYSLCWAGYELYAPMTAEQLATLRVSRKRGKVERAEKKWREENPLLAWADSREEDDS